MKYDRKKLIIKKTQHLYALLGHEGVSMRTLAGEVGVASSVLYHYFSDKDVLLREVYKATNNNLGIERAKLPPAKSANEMLRQRIIFQLDHVEEIVFVLKYFIAQRRSFKKYKTGYVPDKTALHIEEVLQFGLDTGEFNVDDVELDAKVITHAINGFLLEYYPAKLNKKEKENLVNLIHRFLLKAVVKQEIAAPTIDYKDHIVEPDGMYDNQNLIKESNPSLLQSQEAESSFSKSTAGKGGEKHEE